MQDGYRACAMAMGTNGEHMAMLTYVKYLRQTHPDLVVHEAGVAHLSALPNGAASWGVDIAQLPPIMVSPDGYLVNTFDISKGLCMSMKKWQL